MTRFYYNRVLLNLRGDPIFDAQPGQTPVPLTLGNLAAEALMRDLPMDNGVAASLRIIRHKLAMVIYPLLTRLSSAEDLPALDQDSYMTLKTEELNLIKSRIMAPLPNGFPTIVVGAAEVAIEGNIEV